MKTTLTIEESARLVELGVDPKLASKTIVTDEYNEQWENFKHPIFSLINILSILPKEIRLENRLWCNLKIQYIYEGWAVNYSPYAMSIFRAPEFIDALYQLLIWAITNGHVNTNSEKKWTNR